VVQGGGLDLDGDLVCGGWFGLGPIMNELNARMDGDSLFLNDEGFHGDLGFRVRVIMSQR